VPEGPEREAKIATSGRKWRLKEKAIQAGGMFVLAPSGTRAGASTISCAAVPAARAIPAIPSSFFRSKTT